MNVLTREYASWLLSSLYLQLDMLCEGESDLGECLRLIEAAERQYHFFLEPCHLCQKPTLFKDDAFSMPFCWGCLQCDYHFWYRAAVYGRGAERITSTLSKVRAA